MEFPHLFLYNEAMENNEFINIGYIVSTRGLKGVLKVKSCSDFAALRYKKGNKLYLLNPKDNVRTEVKAASYYSEKGFDYVSFLDKEDINLVEKYIGFTIQVNKEEIPPLPKDTYYYNDLINLTCIDENNKSFGKVIQIIDYTPQIQLKIDLGNDKTVLVPYVSFFIKEVSLEAKTIKIHVIDGLINN